MANMERDLWWEARQKTAAQGGPGLSLFRTVSMSLPGAPVRAVSIAAANLGRDKAGLVIDLNKYRVGRDLNKYVDAGVDAFFLRIGGPGRWVSGDWAYTEDPTYRPYLEQLDRLEMIGKTVGYIVHNPFEDWHLVNNVHVDLLNQWTSGGYMPAAFAIDHEVAECWQGGAKITCTAYNLVKSLEAALSKTYAKFRRSVSVYTARWFINGIGFTEHTTFFDNANKPESAGGPGKQYPLWMAWYPQVFSKSYSNLETSLQELLTPTGDQSGKYLAIGSNSKADLWQFTDRLKLTGDDTGVDASVTLGTIDEFMKAFGLSGSTTTPEPEPEPEPDTALEARVQALEDWVKSYK